MKCTDIKLLLSEYIDDMLDETTRKRVDQHLQSCESCQSDYASLKNIIAETGALPKIKAPDDFLENLHARMESGVRLKKIARTLFIPFKIKIPLELVTATAAAVLIFFFVNVYQRSKPLTDIYYAKETPQGSSQHVDSLDAEKAPQVISEDKKISKGALPGSVAKKPPLPAKERTRVAVSEAAKEEAFAMGKAAPAPMEGQEESASLGMTEKKEAEKPIELALVVQSIPMDRTESTVSDREAEPALKNKTTADESNDADSKELYGTSRGGEEAVKGKKADERVQFETGMVKDAQQSTTERIKSIIIAHSGRIISVNADEQTHQPKSILAEVPSSKFKSFYSQLSQMGEVKHHLPAVDETKAEFLRVNIILIPSPLLLRERLINPEQEF